MRSFYLFWPREKICQTVSGKFKKGSKPLDLITLVNHFQLPWSAYVRLLLVKDSAARTFYEIEAMRAGWSVRQLDRQVSSLFYERTALSKDKVAMLAQDKNLPEVTPSPLKRQSKILLY
jgi:hypothetical protein